MACEAVYAQIAAGSIARVVRCRLVWRVGVASVLHRDVEDDPDDSESGQECRASQDEPVVRQVFHVWVAHGCPLLRPVWVHSDRRVGAGARRIAGITEFDASFAAPRLARRKRLP
jgi:hypothetical protein